MWLITHTIGNGGAVTKIYNMNLVKALEFIRLTTLTPIVYNTMYIDPFEVDNNEAHHTLEMIGWEVVHEE